MAELRLPPQAPDSEMAVLGSMLQFQESVDIALGMPSTEMFSKAQHRTVFQAIVDLAGKGTAVDIVTVQQFLAESNQLEAGGGIFYLTELIDKAFSAANIETHCVEVLRRAQLRKIIGIAGKLQTSCYEAGADPDELGGEAARQILELVAYGENDFNHVSTSLAEVIESLETAREHKGAISGIGSGFSTLDHITTGFHGGDLVILAARPGQGKTSMALTIARNAAQKKFPVGMVSLEMRQHKLVMRLLAMEARIDSTRAKLGELELEEWTSISQAAQRITEYPIYLDCSAGQNISKMTSRIRRAVLKYGLKLVIIDYLQLIAMETKYFNRNIEIGIVTRSLKNLAVELDIPIMALSQLSRDIEKGKFRLPILSDLRESGNIENDADVVMFIVRPEMSGLEQYRIDKVQYNTKNLAILLVRKHRDGASNKNIILTFIPERTEFALMDTQHSVPTAPF